MITLRERWIPITGFSAIAIIMTALVIRDRTIGGPIFTSGTVQSTKIETRVNYIWYLRFGYIPQYYDVQILDILLIDGRSITAETSDMSFKAGEEVTVIISPSKVVTVRHST